MTIRSSSSTCLPFLEHFLENKLFRIQLQRRLVTAETSALQTSSGLDDLACLGSGFVCRRAFWGDFVLSSEVVGSAM